MYLLLVHVVRRWALVPRPLGIVYVADIPQVGGASASLFDLVTRMASEHGANCTVLFPSEGPLRGRLDRAGIRTVVTGHRGFLVSRPDAAYKVAPKYILELMGYLSCRSCALRKAEAAIDFAEVDIIHSNLPRNDLGMDLARRHNKPHICHLREFSFEDFGCWTYRRQPAKYLDACTDAFIAVSNACADAWVKRGVDRRKVHVVYNGIDLNRFKHRGDRFDDGKLRLVFLGGCNSAKGVWDALHAMAELPSGLLQVVTLDILGYGSSEVERKAHGFLVRSGLEDNVSILGPSDDIPALLPSYDCGLVCSRSEAFGRVVVEYQSAGLAVIGANSGSLPELLGHGSRGILYDKDEGGQSLASAIVALANNPGMLASLRNRGRSFAELFGIDKTVAGVRKVYEEVLATRGQGDCW